MAEDVFGIVGSLQAQVFRVERVVAEGGFGVVYRAYHEGFRAPVALKCLKVPRAFTGEERATFFAKFREEGELLFRLSALIQAVVRPLHVGSLESTAHPLVPFIALEWLEGESLDALVERRRREGKPPLDAQRAVKLLAPAARALEAAHRFPGPNGERVSILHRDLKPENLFLSRAHGQETIKILDFGIGTVKRAATQIAGHASADPGALSAFTPAYGAPEQWLPQRFGQTGPWTDVWGLALTLTELLIGRAPLEGDASALLGSCLLEAARPTPSRYGVRVTARLEAALERALAVDPRRRFDDVGTFWDEVEASVSVRSPRIAVTPGDTSSVAPPAVVPDLELVSPASVRRAQPSSKASLAPSGERLSLVGNDFLPSVAPLPPRPERRLEVERAPSRPEPSRRQPSALHADVRMRLSDRPTARAVLGRGAPALRLIALGLLIMIADQVYGFVSGAAFAIGPVRAFWIAAPLVVFGLVRLVLTVAES